MELRRVLALDLGGSHGSALVIEPGESTVAAWTLSAATYSTVGATGVARAVAEAVSNAGGVQAVAMGVAAVRTAEDRQSLLRAIRESGIELPTAVYSDARCSLAAARLDQGVALVAGTGSSALAVAEDGSEVRAGGWGRWLGDEGGGYWIARRLVAAAARAVDEGDPAGHGLAAPIAEYLGLSGFDEVRLAASDAARLSRLAPLVGRLAGEGNETAQTLIEDAAGELARLVRLVARRSPLRTPVPVAASGGVFRGLPWLAGRLSEALGSDYAVRQVSDDPALGAYRLAIARHDWDLPSSEGEPLPATERSNPASERIDQLSIPDMLVLMNDEDARVPPAVRSALDPIARLVEETERHMRAGGRLVYVGAGTSGRLAALDAVECVPTFGIEPGKVVAVVAGGTEALRRAVEGAEDDERAGSGEIEALSVGAADVVVGVSASGGAPFVRGALAAADERGAFTALITNNARTGARGVARLVVCVDVGPEVIAGSTRLKAGTSQKLVLNMLSTAVMVRLGRTRGNRMIRVRPTNRKLRERAVRLVRELTGASKEEALHALEVANWDVARAVSDLEAAGQRQ